MNLKTIKLRALTIVLSTITAIALGGLSPVFGQNSKNSKFAIFSEKLPAGAQWVGDKDLVRKGGPKESTHYIYIKPSDSPAELTGLSLPIREKPKAGEYRYITFKWVKWGGDQIGLRFNHSVGATSKLGHQYNYTYVAGRGDSITRALSIDDKAPGHWITVTRDLWKDFGDFTLTGISFICPDRRDAGFDAIFLGQQANAFQDAPGLIPTKVAAPIKVKEDYSQPLANATTKNTIKTDTSEGIAGKDITAVNDSTLVDEAAQDGGAVQVDWMAQLKAGGVWMYPLYLVGLVALVIALQRLMISREARLAPKRLRRAVREHLAIGDLQAALAICEEYPSTMAQALQFIFKHWRAGREVVSQTAGDIAARDIREHLDRIYPLSVAASLAPLLGLLGTIVGMIEAFGLVALYGDAGGPSMLSDSISKALITTAAGLIIAIPAIAVYFVLKRKIKRSASHIEEELEHAITMLYLSDDSKALIASKEGENSHAHTV